MLFTRSIIDPINNYWIGSYMCLILSQKEDNKYQLVPINSGIANGSSPSPHNEGS